MANRRDERSKRQKLDQIYLALRDHNEGLTQSELADIVTVGRWDINRYLKQGDLPGVYEDHGRLFLDRLGDLVRMSFDRDEITMMHVAMRLLSRHTHAHNPHAASALRKLSDVVKRLDPDVSRSLQRTAGQADDPTIPHNEELLNTLRVLTEARLRRRTVSVAYELEDGTLTKPYTFSPYFIEPYAPGLTTHVIGFREPPGDIRTFKVERLRSVKLGLSDFVMPEDFDPTALLEDAWGIWYTNEPAVEVVLKFAPRVRRRVMETRWHRNQADPEVLEDGSVIWRCRIAEPREMLPWVRGWGADVEVLAPAEMRAEVRRNVREMATVYGVMEQREMPKHWLLWAKTNQYDKSDARYHPLLCHLVDVGEVARCIWRDVLTSSSRSQIANAFGLSLEECERFVAFVCAAHDIGKACPAFQQQNVLGKLRLDRAGFKFQTNTANVRHEAVSWLLLHHPVQTTGFFRGEPAVFSGEIGKLVATIISGHHGMWSKDKVTEIAPSQVGDETWAQVQADLYAELCRIFHPPTVVQVKPEDTNKTAIILSGLISVADWIGSREDCFDFASTDLGYVNVDVDTYVRLAQCLAESALRKLNLLDWQPPNQVMPFEQQFALKAIRPTQAALISMAADQLEDKIKAEPTLVIVEDATGSGKTEAALYLADHWAALFKHRGAYVAMPTMATSNQMYWRFDAIVKRRYTEMPNLQLAHSQAAWQESDVVELHQIGDEVSDSKVEDQTAPSAQAEAENWFASRKRTLLSTFGVGTVDQALMSALPVNHFFVRLMALANKTVIFDEVHAYDAFMSEIFERTLMWLRALGSSVVILSATLPIQTRRRLVTAFTGQEAQLENETVYPSVVWASSDQKSIVVEIQPKPSDRKIPIRTVGRNAENIVAELRDALKNGGCAVVICNRVKRAQELYSQIESLLQRELETGWIKPDDLMLFHARFPFEDRKAIEDAVLQKFGKPIDEDGTDSADRPPRAILIATQVVEQSLDLDFDVMFSDVAPIDLLIQRVGRLWRHHRKSRQVSECVLRLMEPEGTGELPEFGKDAYVYGPVSAPYLLMRTWLEVLRNPSFLLPRDTREWIRQVYGDTDQMPDASHCSQAQQNSFVDCWHRWHQQIQAKGGEAARQILPKPNVPTEQLLNFSGDMRSDTDDPTTAKYWRAKTRDIQPSVSLVCLFMRNNQLFYDADCKEPVGNILKDKKLEKQTIKRLMTRVISVTNPIVVDFFADPNASIKDEKIRKAYTPYIMPPAWRTNGALRHLRVAVFINDVCKMPGKKAFLKLSKLGLEVLPDGK
jgi:CRISPR-associated endonuclease/helicase Cas3